MQFRIHMAALGLTACGLTSAYAAPLPLVTDGKPTAVILVAKNATADEELAAKEIQDHVLKISGANLEIRHIEAGDLMAQQKQIQQGKLTPVALGSLAASQTTIAAIKKAGSDPASFALVSGKDGIKAVGLDGQGTLDASYELLEQLGVRWFMPGDLGTVIPKAQTLTVKEQETIQSPSFKARWENAGQDYGDWGRRNRMGGPYFPPAHGLRGVTEKDFPTHPEFFGMVNGQRKKNQLCVSNPEVLKRTISFTKDYFRANPKAEWIGMGPNDGSGFCECPNCEALDSGEWDQFCNERAVTDRYIWFFNQVLDGIKTEFPDKKIAFYCYHTYMRPPVKVKPDPRVVPAFAPIALCRIHGLSNPICPERSYYKSLMEAWGKISPEVYERGYWFNLSDPGLPFSEVHKMRDEIPVAYEMGIKGWRVETVSHWGSETPSLYISSKLMWNHKADVDALLADFYAKFFGPAEKPMAAYGALMDAALRDGDFHTGSSWDMPQFYPKALRDKARGYLDAAEKMAPTGVYAERVKVFRTTFDYLEHFIAMQEQRTSLNFTGANADLKAMDDIQTKLLAYNPPMLNKRAATSYLKRFFRQTIEQGYARTTNGNELVAGLADQWQFQMDPQKIGEDTGLWKESVTGGNWQPLKTSSASWSDQGLRYYKGEVWYRQTVDIPAKFAGKRIFLWFGGVDEKAKVWVNGQLLGNSHGASFIPFEMDATSAVRAGGKNTVAVRLINEQVNELGTGGITAPVMFYAPAAGKDAKLENVRDLTPTFP